MTKRTAAIVVALFLAASPIFAQGAVVPLDHCRIVDTALAQPAPYHLYVGTEYVFSAVLADNATQGGEARSCGVPVGASAIFLTVHARDPYGPGHWRLWPTGTPRPYAAAGTYGLLYDDYLTWYTVASGRTTLVKLNAAGQFSVEVAVYALSRFIVDVQGYVTGAE